MCSAMESTRSGPDDTLPPEMAACATPTIPAPPPEMTLPPVEMPAHDWSGFASDDLDEEPS